MDELHEIEDIEEVEEIERMFNEDPARKRKVYRTRRNPFAEYTPEEFRRKYRFSKEGATELIDMFGEDLSPESDRGGSLSPEIQILTALRCWGRNMMQDDCADLHGISQQSVTNICRRVALCIARARPNFIYMPRAREEEAEVAQQFSSKYGFRSVIGCIDCTHIRIPNIKSDVGQYFINRKGFPSLNVQGVCDATLKFENIVARWHGSVHDARIFHESRLKRQFEAGEFRGRLLGDSGYPCTPYLFTPVRNPRQQNEEAYNSCHKTTRNTIERCFGLWKSRFRCLLTGFRTTLENTKTTIVALAVLHNLAILLKEREFPIEEMEDEELLEEAPEQPNPRGAAVRAAFIQNYF